MASNPQLIFMQSNIVVFTGWVCLLVFWRCVHADMAGTEKKIVYFDDGKTVRQTIGYKDGKRHGYTREFYRNGVLKARQFYVNDSLDDTSAIYYPDGKLQSLQVYKNKRKHGCWKEYNKEGKLYSEIFFKNGFLDSTSSNYTYRTGRLLTRVTYKRGRKNGLEERYYANGKPLSRMQYDDGRPCPGLKEWADNGKEIRNDFAVSVREKNELTLNGTVTYFLDPAGYRQSDEAYTILPPEPGKGVSSFKQLEHTATGYKLVYSIPKGDHILTKEYIAILRKTSMGNTFIKLVTLNVAIDN